METQDMIEDMIEELRNSKPESENEKLITLGKISILQDVLIKMLREECFAPTDSDDDYYQRRVDEEMCRRIGR